MEVESEVEMEVEMEMERDHITLITLEAVDKVWEMQRKLCTAIREKIGRRYQIEAEIRANDFFETTRESLYSEKYQLDQSLNEIAAERFHIEAALQKLVGTAIYAKGREDKDYQVGFNRRTGETEVLYYYTGYDELHQQVNEIKEQARQLEKRFGTTEPDALSQAAEDRDREKGERSSE